MNIWSIALLSSAATAGIILVAIFVPSYFNNSYVTPIGRFHQPEENPLDKFTFESLGEYQPQVSELVTEGVITQEENYTSYLFHFQTQGKKVTGQLNRPKQDGKIPIVVMLRGFVDPSLYQTGIGTRNAAAVFASNGYITIAPDFLGYGGSDMPDNDSFAARMQRPVTVLDLLATINQLEFVDTDQIYLWGHSNGGQIALSVLEITGSNFPTTLWAPVTKPFPYSILYYTDEYDDYGKGLRKALSTFEAIYDVDKYSVWTYLDQIQAPLQLHQGGNDDAVPLKWSNQFVEKLASLEQPPEVSYYTYPQADHNLRPDWDTVVKRDLAFFARFRDNKE